MTQQVTALQELAETRQCAATDIVEGDRVGDDRLLLQVSCVSAAAAR